MDLKRSISYQWRIFFPLVGLLWTVIVVQAVIQYQCETQYRENRLNDDLRLVNSRIINAYEEDIDLLPFMRFTSWERTQPLVIQLQRISPESVRTRRIAETG